MLENDGNKVTVRSGPIPDKETMTYTEFHSPTWKQDGTYMVKITQGANTATAKIEATEWLDLFVLPHCRHLSKDY